MSEEKDQHGSIISDIQKISQNFSHSISEVQRELDQIVASVLIQQERFQEFFESSFKPALENLQAFVNSLVDSFPPHVRKTLQMLGDKGWYADLSMPLVDVYASDELLFNGDVDEAEKILVQHFESELDSIEERITKSFPNRQPIISAAFNAHRKGEYVLSVPVLLAQVDGICKEVTEQSLFSKKNKKPKTASYVEKISSDKFLAALLGPLESPLPVAASEGEREEGWTELNRHMVLHGESLDYGSKVNSLKAISLLNYVVQVLKLSESQLTQNKQDIKDTAIRDLIP